MIAVLFVVSYLTKRGLNGLLSFLSELQMIFLIPLMSLKLPAILSETFETLIPITLVDPFPEAFLEIGNNFMRFKDTLQMPMNTRFSNLGIENRNFIAAIGGNFYILLILHIRKLVIAMLHWINKKRDSPKVNYLISKLESGKNYPEFMVSFIIQVYCDFLMVAIINFENLNIFTSEENPLGLSKSARFAQMTPGDIFTVVFAIVWLLILVISPLFFFAAIMKKSKEVERSKETSVIQDIGQEAIYKDLWGDLELKSDNKWTIHYYPIYFARRLDYLSHSDATFSRPRHPSSSTSLPLALASLCSWSLTNRSKNPFKTKWVS